MFGFDEIYNDLLLEAKSPEEIKKILEYQFVQGKGIPQEILDLAEQRKIAGVFLFKTPSTSS